MALIAGIMIAGCQAFPISPRNSDVAVAHLLKSTGSKYLYVSSDHAMQKLALAASQVLEGLGGITILAMPTFERLFEQDPVDDSPTLNAKVDPTTPALILHSSGLCFTHTLRITY